MNVVSKIKLYKSGKYTNICNLDVEKHMDE